MIPSVRSWPARYFDARGTLWIFGGLLGFGLLTALTASTDLLPWWPANAAWIFMGVLAPLTILSVRAMSPTTGSVELGGGRLEVVRGTRREGVELDQVRVRVLRWEPTPGFELGTVLELADGHHTVALGIRDRRVGTPTAVHRSPSVHVDATVADELLSALEGPMTALPVARPDDPVVVTGEPLTVELRRSGDGVGPVLLMVVGLFGGLLLAGFIGFGVEARGYPDTGGFLLMVLTVAAIVVPQVLLHRHQHGGALTLTVDEESVTVGSRRGHQRAGLHEVSVGRGTTEHDAPYYGKVRTPVISVQWPGKAPLTIGAADVRLRWWGKSRRMKAAHYTVPSFDFQRLAAALGQDLRVDLEQEARAHARAA